MDTKKLDKTNIKSWIDGDTFLVKIKNVSEEYKDYEGKYLALIYRDITNWNLEKNTKVFYAKMIDSKKIPSSINEIERYPSIKMSVQTPYDLERLPKENRKKAKFDEYNYAYIYYCEIKVKNTDIKENFTFIGNIKKIKNEYEFLIDRDLAGQPYYLFNDCQESIIINYKKINLKQDKIYTEQGNKEFLKRRYHEQKVNDEVVKFVKENSELMKEIFKDEKRTNNSLTYVGTDPEKMKQNKRKN